MKVTGWLGGTISTNPARGLNMATSLLTGVNYVPCPFLLDLLSPIYIDNFGAV